MAVLHAVKIEEEQRLLERCQYMEKIADLASPGEAHRVATFKA
jgi:hypothetical protein